MRRLVAILALTAITLLAQTNRGSISGTISDPSSAVVAGASVTVTNLGTNEKRKVATSENGFYSVVDLEPVHYRIEVDLQDGSRIEVSRAEDGGPWRLDRELTA